MIKLDELKPILEPLLNDENSASIIEAISAIDAPEVNNDELIASAVADAKAEMDKEWNGRFKAMFLSGSDSGVSTTEAIFDETGSDDVVDEPSTYEDLFGEKEKESE